MTASSDIILLVRNLKKYFPIKAGFFRKVVGHVRAVDGVDLQVFEGETLRWEHSFVHLNKTFEIYELPLKHPDGSVSHMCIYRDITERKEREKRLTASIEDYRRLFERIGCGVYISSREGRFLDANEALLDMLHYKRKEDLLQIDIAHDLYKAPQERRKYQEIIERDGYVSDYEVDLKRHDGGFVSALINSRVR